MKFNLASKPALLLVDIQKGFDDIEYWGGARNNPDAEQNMAKLLDFWRANDLPLFHIQHCSTVPGSRLQPGQSGNVFKDEVAPEGTEPVVRKTVNSGFIGTDLKEQLDNANVTDVVIIGLTTDQCVSTTTRMAGNYGYNTFIVNDATATFDKIGFNGERYSAQLIHDTALASIKDEFATVVDTADLIGS